MSNGRFSFFVCALTLCGVVSAASSESNYNGIPLDLMGAIDVASSNSVDVRIAKKDISKKLAGVREAQGTFLPTVDLELGETKLKNYDDFSGLQVIANYNGQQIPITVSKSIPPYSTTGSLTAKLNLYAGGAQSARVREASSALEASFGGETIASRKMVLNVVAAYWTLYISQVDYESANRNLLHAQYELNVAAKNYELGKISAIEYKNAQLDALKKETAKLTAEITLKGSTRAYINELGVPYNRDDWVGQMPKLTSEPDDVDVEALVRPFQQRAQPDLQKAGAEITAANEKLTQVRAMYYPQLDLSWSYAKVGRSDNDFGDAYSDIHDDIRKIALILRWNIFNGGQTNSRVQQAQADLSIAKLRLENIQKDLVNQDNVQRTKINTGIEEVELAKKQLEVNLLEESIAAERLKNSQISELQYDEASRSLAMAKAKLNIAKANALLAVIESRIDDPHSDNKPETSASSLENRSQNPDSGLGDHPPLQ